MSTIQSVKNQIQTLIDNANATTGKGDTNLTTAQNSLIEGYGQGGGGVSGTFALTMVKTVNSSVMSESSVTSFETSHTSEATFEVTVLSAPTTA